MSISQDDLPALNRAKAETKLLLNKDLQNILREQGLAISGVKASLQQRVQTRLQNLYDQGETDAFRSLCSRVRPAGSSASYPVNPTGYMARADYANRLDTGYKSSNGYYGASPAYSGAYSGSSYSRPNGSIANVKFPNSPFHEILQPLTGNTLLPVVHQNRHTVTTNFVLGADRHEKLQNDSSLRILVYCTNDLETPKPDIAFPSQVELKVNDEPFQGNLRGIKKKAGTTRPADITALVRRLPNYSNRIAITYAATDKKFTFVVNLVRKHPVESLVAKIKQGNVIAKDSVIREMIKQANDPDIVATSTVMSLKCPLSAMRMTLPCRSTHCNHNQCFDAESFLQLQEQAPQWSCPTCNKVFPFEALAVDEYVQDILRRFPKSTDQVTIEPDGTVKNGDIQENTSSSRSSIPSKRTAGDFESDGAALDDDDDDIIEIGDGNSGTIKSEPSNVTTPYSYIPTPPPKATSASASRTSSVPTSAAPSTSGAKRKQPEVVDLTLSSDDEDDGEPIRHPIKRSSTGGGFNTFNSTLPNLSSRPASNQTHRPFNPTPLPTTHGPSNPAPHLSLYDKYHQRAPPPLSFGQIAPPRGPGQGPQGPTMQSPSWNQQQQPSPFSNYNSGYSAWGHPR